MTDLAVRSMTADDARRLTERIRLTAHTFAESRARLIELVDEAKVGNAHVVLGYPSWTAYLSEVLGDEPLRLARDDRKELVGYLAGEGMSTRAIAPIVGAHDTTVMRDLQATAANAADDTPARPATVTSLDGRQRPATQPKPAVEPKPAVRVNTETGEVTDAPAPRTPPRRPLTDAFDDAIYDLIKVAQRIERLTQDDRFTQNAEKVAARHHSDLLRTIGTLQGAIDRLPQPN